MVDVRALLRAERAAREPTKPRKVQPSAPQISSKKRKDVHESSEQNPRKRPKEDEAFAIPEPQSHDAPPAEISTKPEHSISNVVPAEAQSKEVTTGAEINVDEDEWAAFERDVATPSPSPPRQTAISALQSDATISAAPTTKAELEVNKRREDQQAKRAQREEELAADKEDAARHMEDEFEEMDALEQRIRRLKEQRERLRVASAGKLEVASDGGTRSPAENDEDMEDGDVDDEEDDAWVFGKR